MTIIHKLIIISAIFFLMFFGVFLMVKPQVVQAQYPIVCNPNTEEKRCVGNSIFWFDSCGKQQNWVKDCFNGCLNGQCISNQPKQTLPPPPVYIKHYKNTCNDNNLYWSDSNGVLNDLYKTCSDNNECTKDSCLGSQCVNEGNYKEQIVPFVVELDISTFCGIKDGTLNLSKNFTITADQTINCLIIVKNTSTVLINDVVVRVDIPSEIINTSEVKIDGLSFNGNITSGINIGNFLSNTSKIVTFEGKTQSLINQISAKQITGIASSGTFSVADSLMVNFQPTTTTNITEKAEPSPFIKFLKNWYVWIIITIVLTFLFFIIFKRVSSNI